MIIFVEQFKNAKYYILAIDNLYLTYFISYNNLSIKLKNSSIFPSEFFILLKIY